jgi:hypothetical protein
MSIPSAGYDSAVSLGEVNRSFRDAYADERARATDAPILVVLADELILFRGSARTSFAITPDAFTHAKIVSHAPVALWLLLQKPASHEALARLRAFITQSHRAKPDPILADTLAWMDRIPFDLNDFASAFGPRLMTLIGHATQIQLKAMHAAAEAALAQLSADERGKLQVAVTGDHQARVRSLAMQYFQKRFADRDRVLYAEGVSDPDEAAALVGAQRLDQEMARAFFGDRRRLQRDLLGDAAKHELAKTELSRIDLP